MCGWGVMAQHDYPLPSSVFLGSSTLDITLLGYFEDGLTEGRRKAFVLGRRADDLPYGERAILYGRRPRREGLNRKIRMPCSSSSASSSLVPPSDSLTHSFALLLFQGLGSSCCCCCCITLPFLPPILSPFLWLSLHRCSLCLWARLGGVCFHQNNQNGGFVYPKRKINRKAVKAPFPPCHQKKRKEKKRKEEKSDPTPFFLPFPFLLCCAPSPPGH